MKNIEIATAFAENVAKNNYYGYSQPRRNTLQDEDCSSLVINALREGDFEMKGATYTGDMEKPLLNDGFKDITSSINLKNGAGLKRGDVLLRPKTASRNGHAMLSVGNGKIVSAQKDYDGKLGDSSGKEIAIIDYYDGDFSVYRYETMPKSSDADPHLFSVTLKMDMNVRSTPNSSSKNNIMYVAKSGIGLGIAETSGNWGRIQNQVNPPAWICIADKYVTRSE